MKTIINITNQKVGCLVLSAEASTERKRRRRVLSALSVVSRLRLDLAGEQADTLINLVLKRHKYL